MKPICSVLMINRVSVFKAEIFDTFLSISLLFDVLTGTDLYRFAKRSEEVQKYFLQIM